MEQTEEAEIGRIVIQKRRSWGVLYKKSTGHPSRRQRPRFPFLIFEGKRFWEVRRKLQSWWHLWRFPWNCLREAWEVKGNGWTFHRQMTKATTASRGRHMTNDLRRKASASDQVVKERVGWNGSRVGTFVQVQMAGQWARKEWPTALPHEPGARIADFEYQVDQRLCYGLLFQPLF